MSLSPCHLISGVTPHPPRLAALPVNFILARQEMAVTSSSDSARPPLYYCDGDVLKLCLIKVTPGVSQGGWYEKSGGGYEFIRKIKFEA